MGEKIGTALGGTLYFVPYSEFERVRSLDVPVVEGSAVFANLCRINTLYMIARAGSGHIGSSFSSLDVVSWLLLNEMKAPEGEQDGGDVYFSSKGHDAPGYYAALIGLGRLEFDLIHRLRRLGGLPGHPDVSVPGVVTNTGSLGMGVSKAKGMVSANRLLGRPGRVYVMTGDGELQEGQFWESLASAANAGLHEITVIVDHNKLQSDTLVSRTSDLGDLEAKLGAFGWHVERIDGHDMGALQSVLKGLRAVLDKPKVIVADTVKGRGVSFMESTAGDSDVAMYRFHSGAPGADDYRHAVQELVESVNAQLSRLGAAAISLEAKQREEVAPSSDQVQSLIGAYSRSLVKRASESPNLVALDADLMKDTGLIPFRNAFPDRFFECGIAEQDMVSQAGGMALKGLLPVVHSFACFLSTRPNEQIYNNATEGTKVVYVGSLAGVVPGGPGHSHQSVRDICALGGIPGLTLIEPCTEDEVEMAVDYCLDPRTGSCYLRLVSLPWPVPFSLPQGYRLEEGVGATLVGGSDAVLFSYGPVTLSAAHEAANLLKAQGISLKVVNLPWLNRINREWLLAEVRPCRAVFTLDNHHVDGGQGELITSTLAETGELRGVSVRKLGVSRVPVCGTNREVLRAHGLDAEGLAEAIVGVVGASDR